MSDQKPSERTDRIAKLEELKKLGIDPYPAKTDRDAMTAQVLNNFEKLSGDKTEIILAGRLRSLRTHGNLTFADLEDDSGRIQLVFSKKDLPEGEYKILTKYIDMGDFVEAKGCAFMTQAGQQSLQVSSWKLLTKALRPLPDKWAGLQDEEEKLRKRYLDILFNPEVKELFVKKAKFWEVTRNFMKEKGFLEVETPTLEVTTGGAEATPFKTHHNDYDLDVYLRISVGELWQKRLMAAGFDKTFEIGRTYRNEGSSPEHLQEFTNMEFYWGYANYRDSMKLVQEMYRTIAQETFGTTKFETRGHTFDLADEWKEIDYSEEIKRLTGIDIFASSEDDMKAKLDELKVKYEGSNRERLTDTLWKHCRKQISGPAFLINHPVLVAPLAKSIPGTKTVQMFQPIIAGSEMGRGYSELNDPIDQQERFDVQQKLIDSGDTEAMMADIEFVEMLEYGIPPTSGFGFGERFFSFLADKSIRECQIFPLMRPKNQ